VSKSWTNEPSFSGTDHFAPPHKVFPLVAALAGRNHNLSLDPGIFATARFLGEKTARKEAGKTEITIEDIYVECRSLLNLSRGEVDIYFMRDPARNRTVPSDSRRPGAFRESKT
jgi:hypothetical protein